MATERLPQFKSVTATRQRSRTWQHRSPSDDWYAYWSKPTVDYNDNKEVWASYIVYPSSQRGIFEPYTGWPRDIKEFHKNVREHLREARKPLVTMQAHDDLHN